MSTHVMRDNIIHIVSPCMGQIKEATRTIRKQDPALPENSALNGASSMYALRWHAPLYFQGQQTWNPN